jgi:twinkle protein
MSTETEEKRGGCTVYRVNDCLDEMLHDLSNGKKKGSTTHNKDIDQCWTWRPEEFNIWTGYANEGKSLFLKQLCMPKALEEDWKFAFCSPEDYPPAEFFDDMIHSLSGLTTDKDRKNLIKKDLYVQIADILKDRFYFVYIDPPHNTIKGVLEEFRKLHEKVGLNGCIIDPLLKFARPKGFSERDDIYASYVGSICVDFARKTNTSLHLVMHQVTPRIGEDKKYPEPSMYSMKGGGSWADGCDNVLSVWRPNYAQDKANDEVEFSSQKIKKQKLVGIPQRFKMKFNRITNRYIDYNKGTSLFDFDKMIYK